MTVHWSKNPVGTKQVKRAIEGQYGKVSEDSQVVDNLKEFIESVRALREMEKHYEHDRNEFNLSDMRRAQRKVDELLKQYPKKGWKK